MITVKFGGIYKERVNKKYRTKGIKLRASIIVEVISALNQNSIFEDDLKDLIRDHPTSFMLGRQIKTARMISPEQASGNWRLHREGQGVTLHIGPVIGGAVQLAMAAVIKALVTLAITLAVNFAVSKIFPADRGGGGETRANALYENGLQTQQEGVPLPWVAGIDVPCGFNVIEADIDITEGGPGTYYDLGSMGGGQTGGVGSGSGDANFDGNIDGWQDIIDLIRGSGGGGGGKARDNNLFSTAILRILGAPGAGPLAVVGDTFEEQQTNIFFNDTPWRDPGTWQLTKQGVGFGFRSGVPGQSALPITPGVSSTFNVTQELRKTSPQGATLPGIIVPVTSANAHRVKARLGLTLLFTGKEGDQYDSDVVFAVDVKRANASSWTPRPNFVVKGKTTNPVQRQINIYAPPAGAPGEFWQYRIRRITADSNSDKLVNATQFMGWTEIIDKELTYDGSTGGVPTALLGFQLDLSQFDVAKGPPQILVRMVGRAVPVPLGSDPDNGVYPDPWLGEFEDKPTQEPVWHLRAMATDQEMGLGYEESTFNDYELLEMAKYNSQLVGDRRRYTLNHQFADREDGWETLVSVAQSFGAMLYWNGAGITVVQDRPTGKVDTYINSSDVEGRTFAEAYTNLKYAINEVTVEFADRDNFGRINAVTVRDDAVIARCRDELKLPNGGRISERLRKRGCCTRAEAEAWGRKRLYEAQNQNRTKSWRVGLAGIRYLPGWIAELDDERRIGGHRGRIAEIIDANHIRLDAPIQLEPYEPYTLRSSRNAEIVKIELDMLETAQFSDIIYVENHGLDATVNVGITKPDDVQPETFRILSIEAAGTGLFNVSAQLHDESKFAYLDGLAPSATPSWPRMDFKLGTPVVLPVTHSSQTDTTTGATHTLNIGWLPVPGQLRNYVVEVMGPRDSDFSMVYSGRDTYCRVPNAVKGNYRITVTAVNTLGVSFDAGTASYDLTYDGVNSTLKAPIFLGLD